MVTPARLPSATASDRSPNAITILPTCEPLPGILGTMETGKPMNARPSGATPMFPPATAANRARQRPTPGPLVYQRALGHAKDGSKPIMLDKSVVLILSRLEFPAVAPALPALCPPSTS